MREHEFAVIEIEGNVSAVMKKSIFFTGLWGFFGGVIQIMEEVSLCAWLFGHMK